MEEPALAKACDLEVPIVDGKKPKLLEATPWQLFNIRMDDILALPLRIWELCGESEKLKDVYDVWDLLLERNLNAKGWSHMTRSCLGEVGEIKMIVPSSKHYAWQKAPASLGLGTSNIIGIFVDADARMDMHLLDEALAECLDSRNPVLLTVAIYGLEGSKLGASAAAVFLSHQVIRPSVSGYGQILSLAPRCWTIY